MKDVGWFALAVTALAFVAPSLERRLGLSIAKHRSLAGHTRIAKRVAEQLPYWEYVGERFFDSDDASADVAARRRAGIDRLTALYAERFPNTVALTASVCEHIPDLEFTSRYRVPFQYSAFVRSRLPFGAFAERSDGVRLVDLDGNALYDLTGSYGVNVFGYEFYKACIADGATRAHALGPVLGAYHPAVADNVKRLCAISGMDAVSFHMSGTEAVMQAVRLARYHTGRSHLVRFAGAYHGWWEDVQPGVGNPVQPHECHTLNGDGRTYAAHTAPAARHCVRVGESAAGAASECGRAERFVARRRQPPRTFRFRGVPPMAFAFARGLRRSAASC